MQAESRRLIVSSFQSVAESFCGVAGKHVYAAVRKPCLTQVALATPGDGIGIFLKFIRKACLKEPAVIKVYKGCKVNRLLKNRSSRRKCILCITL